MRVCILGGTGLVGHHVTRLLAATPDVGVIATARASGARRLLERLAPKAEVIPVGDLLVSGALEALLAMARPDVVINCLSAARQDVRTGGVAALLPALSLFPRHVAHCCQTHGVRLIQFSSDAVFSGARGSYTEFDAPDATDAYGVAKRLGEVSGAGVTCIRTSTIGPELCGHQGLLDWLLSQADAVRGFTSQRWSGLPAITIARLMRDVILRRPDVDGVVHLAGPVISKYDLLRLLVEAYGHPRHITPDDSRPCDRSLLTPRFTALTGYTPETWPQLLDELCADHAALHRSAGDLAATLSRPGRPHRSPATIY